MAHFLAGPIWGIGLAVAAGATVVAGRTRRPLAKQVLKTGLVLGERARQAVVEASEQLQDIYAEARAEREERTVA